MSVNELDPGREIARAAKIAVVTVLLCILMMLPAAWIMMRGIVPTEGKNYVAGGAMALSAFLTQRLFFPPKGRGEAYKAVLQVVVVFAVLLLLTAGLKGASLAPGKLLPYVGCSLGGYLTAVLTKNNKKHNMRNKQRKKYNK